MENILISKNKLILSDDLVCEDKWIVECIKKRTDKLINFFERIYFII